MPARLIVRLPNWLGDTVMAVPALRAVRAGWPETRVLVAGPWAHILAGQGLADTLATYPRAWRGRIATADTIRGFRAEMAILLPNSFEAALTAWYWGAKRRVGFAVGGRTRWLTDRVVRPAARLHQVDEYLQLVEHVGLPIETRVPAMVPPEPESEARQRARRLLDEVLGAKTRPRVGLHLGAEHGPAKLWPVRRMIEGVRTLEAAGMAPVLLGAPRDAPLAVTIGAAVDVATLVGRDEPALLPALLSELDVVVAGDTGISHLASALGTPVIALFGPTDPALSAPRGPASVLVHPVPCAPCFYRACPIEHPCLDGITAKQVVDAVCAAHVGERQIAHVGERRIGGGADGGFGGRPEPSNFK